MKYYAWSTAVALLGTVPALGCASDRMHDGADSATLDIARVEVEVERHHDVVMEATDLEEVTGEATLHDERMGRIMDHMDESVSRMMHCSNESMRELRGMMRSMGEEMEAHLGELEATRDIETLQGECASHVEDILEMLDGMRATMGQASCMD